MLSAQVLAALPPCGIQSPQVNSSAARGGGHWSYTRSERGAGAHHWDCFSMCCDKDQNWAWQCSCQPDFTEVTSRVSAKSLCSHVCNTGARLSKQGAELPQISAPKQANFAQNRYRVRIATICKLTHTNAKTVVLHLLVAITGNKQGISVVLKCLKCLRVLSIWFPDLK